MIRHSRQLQTHRGRAFTLIEIVFALSLIALMAGFVASYNFESLLNNAGTKPAYEIFREATHEARLQAINEASVVYLSYDPESQKFLLRTDAAPAIQEEDSGFGTLPTVNRYGYLEDEEDDEAVVEPASRTEFQVYDEDLEVIFRGLKAESDGVADFSGEYFEEPLPYLVFHPSGVSSLAEVILRDANGDELVLTLDAFSNGPQLSLDEGVGF
ncbi:pilus assembly FimT family protein [Cerasicoccus fimbriatus]|uniref:pilus assembly FimT family protein n=1 Tax=Cerasicoccus fimbriatus TaxID=3014554 RepID=UPI0022B4474D|nr:type II secretion system protein [Cerasicoccus sp. TK19100]